MDHYSSTTTTIAAVTHSSGGEEEQMAFQILSTERLENGEFTAILKVCMAIFVVSTFRILLNSFPRLSDAIPESGWLMLFGVVIGFLSHFVAGYELFPFNEELFMTIFVPLIIFEAG